MHNRCSRSLVSDLGLNALGAQTVIKSHSRISGRAKFALRNSVCAFVILLPVAAAGPALAAGPNTSAPLPTPGTPAPVITSGTQTAIAGDATCAQQLTTAMLNTSIASTALSGAATAAALAALALPPPADLIAEVAAGVVNIGATASAVAQNVYQATANGLPSCDQSFTGTVSVTAGGVNVTGNSIFQNNVGVVGDLAVGGSVNASQMHASQGISAMGGRISLGDPNGVTYSDGITLGGGALSGAGFGGPQAFTGDVTAIAIGNGAGAFSVNSTAVGTGANAVGVNSTAVGANSTAGFSNSAAFGSGATTTRANQQTFGTTNNNYTMPGITSGSSRSAQSGLLQLPTTDALGNLASDGGATFMAIARVQAGVAVAMAMAPPTLAHGEKVGIRVGWGGFNSYGGMSNALGVNAAGVVAENTFSKSDRLTVDLGVGLGTSQFMGYRESSVVGGRAGVQLTW